MEEISVKIPDDLAFMKNVSDIDWSILINKILRSKFEEISELKKIAAKSQLTEKDIEEFTNKINTALAKRYEAVSKK